ncbi:MAG: dethiobiotin synthase [Bacteroidales bacterium]|nr:dethiobiotin synthase [Bacteroidales bacterium]
MDNMFPQEFPERLFITGIDTDAGKSYATGWLAKSMMERGMSVVTQKFVQTGNQEFSEDIQLHRRITGQGALDVDLRHLTAPIIFTYPASPELAARIDGREIDFDVITGATETLLTHYDHVLIEGAGGLMVPLKGEYLTIDYIRDHNLPVVLVTNSTLGSINHTLLSLNAIKDYGLRLFAVIYNHHFDTEKPIADDTCDYTRRWLKGHFPDAYFLEMGTI